MESSINKKQVFSTVFRVLLILIGGALTAESVFAFRYANTIHQGIVLALIIGLPLLVLGVFYKPITTFFRRNLFGRIAKWVIIAAYALFVAVFTVTSVLIQTAADSGRDRKPDTLIVLGAGIVGSRPTATLAYRLETAVEYYEKDPSITIVVSGGMGRDEQTSEADVMRNWLIDNGVDPSNIIVEDRSRNTEENFRFSFELIEKYGKSEDVAFVTSRFHVFRAGQIAKKLGYSVFGIPAREFKPLLVNDYLRECCAIVYYRLGGRI